MTFSPFTAVAFVTIFGLLFALFLLLAGLFTAYFGSGKSRKIGAGLVVGGLVVGLLLGLLYHTSWGGVDGALVPLLEGTIVVLVASALGALAAIGLFLVAIMKS
jgi:hypothetical protein